MGPLKALGSDGFQPLFFQHYCNLIGAKVCEVVLNVLREGEILVGLKETFIVLIPKTSHLEMVSQFRPIGLCNVAYKIKTKCMINRLKQILPKITSSVQSSFIPGLPISDNIIIMQELLESMRKKSGGRGWMVIKLNLEKAYERMRWTFIQATLERMKLPTGMTSAIMRCILMCYLNKLWDGVTKKHSNSPKGYDREAPSHHTFS